MSAVVHAWPERSAALRMASPGTANWRPLAGGCAASVALVAVAAAVGAVLQHGYRMSTPVLLLFLLAVLASASRYGLTASLLACVCSAATFDFCFTEPLYSFAIARPQDVISFLVFCVVAVTASGRTARLREQTLAAERRTAFVAALYRLAGTLAGSLTREAALSAVRTELAATLAAELTLLPADTSPVTVSRPEVFEARLGAPEPAQLIRLRRDGRPFSDAERSLAGAMVGLLDLSLARLALSERVEQAHIDAARQSLAASVLDSLSHDLRSPLASILAATEILCGSAALQRDAAEPLWTIRAEAERLNRLAANLLDMLRVDGGHLAPQLRIEDPIDAISAVTARCGALLGRHRLRLLVPADLPWVRIDHALFEPVLFNLLENAAKFAPAGSVIEVAARPLPGDRLDISVRDEGPGLPDDALDAVFGKFVRLPASGGAAGFGQAFGQAPGAHHAGRAGAGLGLAICRGFVAAMGGSIAAANRGDRSGAVFTVTLPAVAAAPMPELAAS